VEGQRVLAVNFVCPPEPAELPEVTDAKRLLRNQRHATVDAALGRRGRVLPHRWTMSGHGDEQTDANNESDVTERKPSFA
jgi:hypothetical protein